MNNNAILNDCLFVNPDGTIDYIVTTKGNQHYECKDILKPLPKSLARYLTSDTLCTALRCEFLTRYHYKSDDIDIDNWQAELNRRIG